ATGPGIISPHWAIPRPYQPSELTWTPRVLAATNPIWVDADNDGKFSSPRDYARDAISKAGLHPENLLPALTQFDQAVAEQAAELCSQKGADVNDAQFQAALRRASLPVQAGFGAYMQAKDAYRATAR